MKFIFKSLIINVLMIIVLLWIIFPLFWLFISSFKSNVSIFDFPPTIFFNISLDAYKVALSLEWLNYFKNSIIASLSSAFIALVIGIPAAYALARYEIKRKNFTMITILSIRMMPPIVTIIPLFLMFSFLNLIDNHFSLILVYTVFNIPYVVWIMRGFIEEIPKEAEEAALIDGASVLQIITKVVLPISKPGLITTFIFCLVQAWNDFLIAFVLTNVNAKTVPVALASLVGTRWVLWNQLFAVGVINTVPALILAYIIRNYWIKGLTLGMVKG
ncbi:MAG: carbohydrate ABC transporter permease [Nitrososphaeria archaeon]